MDRVKEIYNPKLIEIDDYDEIRKIARRIASKIDLTRRDREGLRNGNVMEYCCQLHTWKKSKELVETYQKKTGTKYDMIVRLRPDLTFNTKFDLKLATDEICIPNIGQYYLYALNDQFAAGPYEDMLTYLSLYDNLVEYFNKRVTYMLRPEFLLKYHLDKNNIAYSEKSISYHILRPNNTITIPITVNQSRQSKNFDEWSCLSLRQCFDSYSSRWVLDTALTQSNVQRDGYWLEFGVGNGNSLRNIVKNADKDIKNISIVGFDSFEGLPEDWSTIEKKGAFKQDKLPDCPGAKLVVGWYDKSLVPWLDSLKTKPKITFLHMDCDLYSSTKYVLSKVAPFLVPGTIIVFDELTTYNGFEFHEWRALYECVVEEKLFEFEWIAHQENTWMASSYSSYQSKKL
jgi:hypothetical protein